MSITVFTIVDHINGNINKAKPRLMPTSRPNNSGATFPSMKYVEVNFKLSR